MWVDAAAAGRPRTRLAPSPRREQLGPGQHSTDLSRRVALQQFHIVREVARHQLLLHHAADRTQDRRGRSARHTGQTGPPSTTHWTDGAAQHGTGSDNTGQTGPLSTAQRHRLHSGAHQWRRQQHLQLSQYSECMALHEKKSVENMPPPPNFADAPETVCSIGPLSMVYRRKRAQTALLG